MTKCYYVNYLKKYAFISHTAACVTPGANRASCRMSQIQQNVNDYYFAFIRRKIVYSITFLNQRFLPCDIGPPYSQWKNECYALLHQISGLSNHFYVSMCLFVCPFFLSPQDYAETKQVQYKYTPNIPDSSFGLIDGLHLPGKWSRCNRWAHRDCRRPSGLASVPSGRYLFFSRSEIVTNFYREN